ncbi:hypothetical protein RHHCN13_07175 [Rickettsia conorii subsp. heilongjiangensis]|uniref:Palindromic element RPE4 domain-containing protein n=2 Tax=spotted fever group TaxID=114277 RepID=A0ABM6YF02_RICJA|nr:hypothetical protein D0Z68_00480 [Rickettsia japonica]BBM90901.1 hypothetical protein RHCH81_07175 [Rickettsia conorii subsp. heilongjiangensis]QHE24741.1 hypothetical protein GRX81_02895 [Rickettsia japonica]BBM92110.1 hypothetical protein RHHCN13_07175 [Rickettsia conorii subsp. heilongjiangensis]BBM93319.1 hypothetical protein RHSENDAI29_07175 [Rickettsia conorii subsp. heilongjiangensis]
MTRQFSFLLFLWVAAVASWLRNDSIYICLAIPNSFELKLLIKIKFLVIIKKIYIYNNNDR